MSPPKSAKSSERVRKKPSAVPEPPPRQRLNLGCGTLLIGICILGLLGKFLPHAGRRTAAPEPAKAASPAPRPKVELPGNRSLKPAPPSAKAVPVKPRPEAGKAAPAQETPRQGRPVVFNSPWDGSVAQVEHHVKKGLYDASSFEALEWGKVAETGQGFKVRCRYRSRNLLGVVAEQSKTFLLNRKGEVYRVTD